jgi:hypothetical protein
MLGADATENRRVNCESTQPPERRGLAKSAPTTERADGDTARSAFLAAWGHAVQSAAAHSHLFSTSS